MNHQTYLQENQKEVLTYLKSRFPMYHLSNFFFRDIQFGLQAMFVQKGSKLSYTEAEKLARKFVEDAERTRIFTPIDGQSWRVNYPEFRKPQTKKPAAKPKPAARPAPAPNPAPPAAAGAPPSAGGAAEAPSTADKATPADPATKNKPGT